ncbi:MAG: flagellar hook-associated protein FlgK [Oscillospiraceae bacterium]|jgi:flagellar hook-associated protein 1 FlgK|nr:flagellar hook-associated protein FlgK [Oscillospiraceae bacterium]
MRSTFAGLDIANRGLFVAQRQIDLAGHNIANANTEGYTRQRFITAAVPPPGMNTLWLPIDKGRTGGGVVTLTVDQIRDRFLDKQVRNELTRTQYWDERSSALSYIEGIFNDLDASSLNTTMTGFFNSLQELSKNTTDGAVRAEVVERAKSMTDMFHSYNSKFVDQMYQQDEMVAAQGKHVSDLGRQISELNQAIFKYELTGNNANDLRDKRNLLLDELAGLVDISYQEVGSGKTDINGMELTTLTVRIGGADFVDHSTSREIVATQTATNDIVSANASLSPLYELRFADDNSAVPITGGAVRSYLDLRDGNSVSTQGLPYFKARLDTLVRSLVTEFNTLHETGYTLPYTDTGGTTYPSRTGVPFFDPAGLTIDTFSLSADILANACHVAASGEPVRMDASGHYETGNNQTVLDQLIKLAQRSDVPIINSSFEKFYNTFITELASEVAHSNTMLLQEYALLDGLTAQRASVSGVSLDEEMTDLLRFQHAYNAAARVITTMDEALDVLINRTGRVGL